MSLELLSSGGQAEIIEVTHCGGCGGGCHGHGHHDHHEQKTTATRAERMGLTVGKVVRVLKNDGQLLLLLVDEVLVAIDRSIARTVRVKEYAV